MGNEKIRITIGDIVGMYGSDLSEVNLNRFIIDMRDCEISDVILPKDKDFFRKVWNKNIESTVMPKDDYSGYDFEGVNVSGTKFTEDSILPKDRSLFQKIANKSLSNTNMPSGDYSEYNFDGVNIFGTKFTTDSKLPNDRSLFQKVEGMELRGTHLPEADYSEYNFNKVYIRGAKFTTNSVIPKNKDLFIKLFARDLSYVVMPKGDYKDYCFENVECFHTNFTFDSLLPETKDFLQNIYKGCDNMRIDSDVFKLTKNVIENIHHYDLDCIEIDLRKYADYLTNSQLSLLRIKYKDSINKDILLPVKGFLKEKDMTDGKYTNKELTI